jgi:hypothetical protein
MFVLSGKENIMDIKEEIQKCKENIKLNEGRIKYIKSLCIHKNIKENHYIDYDRNMYSIICLDCDTEIFDGNQFELEEFYKKRS